MHFALVDILLSLALWLGVVAYFVTRMKTVKNRISDRLQQAVTDSITIQTESIDTTEASNRPLIDALVNLGSSDKLFNYQQQRQMAKMLVRGGWRTPMAVPLLIGCKLACGVSLALLSLLYTLPERYSTMTMRSIVLLAAFMVGMLLPELLAKNRGTRRQQEIEHALPDALDLLVICTNAGYSLGHSLKRAASELLQISPALSDELEVTASELQLSGDSGTALRNLSSRVDSISLRSLVVTLLQSQQYGTPITQALRQLARSERTARMLRLEEKAAKLSTKITMPMVLLILPSVVVISAGPAVMGMMKLVGN